MTDYRPIDTAPRDGTFVEVAAPGEFGPFEMRWNSAGFNPIASLRPGLWETRWKSHNSATQQLARPHLLKRQTELIERFFAAPAPRCPP